VIDEDPKVLKVDFANRTYLGDGVKVTPVENIINSGTIKERKPYTDMSEAYSKTEIDSKLDLVNQKVEHNQEKMEFIVSQALDKIGDKIALLETSLDKKLSDFKAEIFGFLIIAILVPFLTVMVPIISESIKDINSRNSLVAPADNQSK
jgi:hypothetical protein